MQASIEELHEQFYAETNYEIKDNFKCWQIYAQWLEKLVINKLNQKLISENKKLRESYYEVIDILENALTDRLS
ncbi:MAG: hypothetical protein WC860_06665 [Candidatus Margulisiibacteriota bacterium]|jgi:hypothetical protein